MKLIFTFLACLILQIGTVFAETQTANPLAAFDRYIGKTFVGTSADGKTTDIQKWESVLGGKVIRILHAVNGGTYGGETLVYFDNESQSLAYVYVTTANFSTAGHFTIEKNGDWSATEKVKGHETIAAVRSNGSIDKEGRLLSNATYINKDGSETAGHSFVYIESPDAELIYIPK